MAPAVALICGIVLGEYRAAGAGAPFVIVALAALGGLVIHALRRPLPRAGRVAVVAVVGTAAAVGVARHRAAVSLAADHLARFVPPEGVLSRIAGELVTAPVQRPAERRNPFTFVPPHGSVSFVISADAVLTQHPQATSGLVHVRVSLPSHVDTAASAAILGASAGDRVVLLGRLYRPRGPHNTGEVDWAALQRLEGIFVRLAVDDPRFVTLEPAGRETWSAIRSRARAWARAGLLGPGALGAADEHVAARLLDAIVLGQRSATSRQIDEAFIRTGTVHILSVSGFHVAVLAGGCWLLFRRLWRRGMRTAAVLTLAVLFGYGLIAEPNAPIVRALLMAGLACVAALLGRPISALNWLAAAALGVLLWNPLDLFRAGFQLSFVQVLALLWFTPPLTRLLLRTRRADLGPQRDADSWPAFGHRLAARAAAGLVAVSVVAWLAALPLAMHHFGQLTPWGALQSMLLAPPFAIVIILGFVAVLTGWIPYLGTAFAGLTAAIADRLCGLVELLAGWPGSWIETAPPPAILVMLAYAAILAGYVAFRSGESMAAAAQPRAAAQTRPGPRVAWVASIAVGTVVWTWWLAGATTRPAAACQVRLLSVGNGAAILLTTATGESAVFDLGTISNVDVGATARIILRRLGVRRLAFACVSHENYDHYSGLPGLLTAIPAAQRLVNPYYATLVADDPGIRLLERRLPRPGPPPTALAAGDGGALGGVRFEVLWPPEGLSDWPANERSLVIRLSVAGVRILLTGDIESRASDALLAAHAAGAVDLRAEVLVAPHHGAVLPTRDLTGELYATVNPRWVLASTGKPRPELAPLVREAVGPECQVLSTRDVGEIIVTISADGRIDVNTPFTGQRTASLP